MAGPYYVNTKQDDVDFIEESDLEAIEDSFASVDADKAERVVPAAVGDFATLDATGNPADSGKTPPSGEVVGTSDTQTLTGKTLTAPDINGGSLDAAAISGGTIAGAGISGGTITSVTISGVTLSGADVLAALAGTSVVASTLEATGNLTVGGNAGIAGTLDVTGLATLGTASASALSVDALTADQTVNTVNAVGGTAADPDVDCSTGNYFTFSATQNCSFDFSSVPTGAYFMVIEVTHTTGDITWPASVVWQNGGSAPSITAGNTHLFMFVTDDAGVRWRGASIVNYPN